MLETLQQLDQQLLLFLNSFHNTYWDSFMWIFTGKLTWVPMYAAILYVLLKNFSLRMTLLITIAIALTIVFSDQICATFIRPAVERMRPSNLNNPISEFIHIVNDKRGGRFGFPSCHSSNSFGLAFFLILFFRNKLLTLFILFWAIVTCYTRIYLGVHYPGDLFAGMFVGLGGALLTYFGLLYVSQKSALGKWFEYDANKDEFLDRNKITHTNSIIYVGLATISIIALYSLKTLC